MIKSNIFPRANFSMALQALAGEMLQNLARNNLSDKRKFAGRKKASRKTSIIYSCPIMQK
jgi:hypothetical protein